MKKIFLFSIYFSIIVLAGCQGFIMDQMMTSATNNMIKIMREQARQLEEQRKLSYVIEGEVKKLEMREIEITNLDESKIRSETRIKNTNEYNVNTELPKKKQKIVVVIFSDGREKEFSNVPTKPLKSGVYYEITYNGADEVVSVKEKP